MDKVLQIILKKHCCRTSYGQCCPHVHRQSCFISRTMDIKFAYIISGQWLQFIHGQNGYLLYMDKVASSAEPLGRCLQVIHGQSGCILYMDKVATVAKPWTDVCKLYINKCLLYRTNLLHQQSHGQLSANYTWTKWLRIVHGQTCYSSQTMD